MQATGPVVKQEAEERPAGPEVKQEPLLEGGGESENVGPVLAKQQRQTAAAKRRQRPRYYSSESSSDEEDEEDEEEDDEVCSLSSAPNLHL